MAPPSHLVGTNYADLGRNMSRVQKITSLIAGIAAEQKNCPI
jgi:hypothetical protein